MDKIKKTKTENSSQSEYYHELNANDNRDEIDELTGIYNKQTFFKFTRKLLESDIGNEYVLIRWNIERFKLINNIFGTETGDLVLRKVGQKLNSLFPDTGICGRIEADHFVNCFPASELDIEGLLSDMEQYIETFLYDFKIVLGAGIYSIEDLDISVDMMCDRAKLALNTINGNYLKRYAFYKGSFMDELIKEQHMINEMHTALEDNQFELYLQPQYNHSTGKIIGAEALTRWNHPNRGVIQPNIFIPLFEKNGFIIRLDEYICERVCIIIREWIDSGRIPVPVSINISRIDIYHLRLSKLLIDMLKKYELSASMIKLEITETAYMENPEQFVGVVRELQSNGFIVQMDDFGSGYSSLNMLLDVPFDVLKLDLKFLYDDLDKGRSGNILNSVIGMAKSLNVPVIAEGVETRPQADYLKDIGCEMIQGFYYGKPVPAESFNELFMNIQSPRTDQEKILQ